MSKKPKPLDEIIVLGIRADLDQAAHLRHKIARYELLAVRLRRELRAYSNKKIAEKHKVDASTISKINTGHRHGNT